MGLIVMIAGLAVFLGTHLVTTHRDLRAALIARFGASAYKVGYSLLSAIGLVLIVYGFSNYRATGWINVWYPPVGDAAPGAGADAAGDHHLRLGLSARLHLAFHEASDACRHQDLGTCASAGQRRPRLDHPVRLVPRLGGVRSHHAEAPRGSPAARRSRSAACATTCWRSSSVSSPMSRWCLRSILP